MKKVIRGVPKEAMAYMIQLFSPTMDDYLYVVDLKEDYYMISPQAVERFRLRETIFTMQQRNTKNLFMKKTSHPYGTILRGLTRGRRMSTIWITAGWTARGNRPGSTAAELYCVTRTAHRNI